MKVRRETVDNSKNSAVAPCLGPAYSRDTPAKKLLGRNVETQVTRDEMTDRTPRKGDASQRAWSVVQEATGQVERRPEKNPEAIARGRAGGLKRAENLTAERRLEIAKQARASRRSA